MSKIVADVDGRRRVGVNEVISNVGDVLDVPGERKLERAKAAIDGLILKGYLVLDGDTIIVV